MIFFRKEKTFLGNVTDGLIDSERMFKILNPGIPAIFQGMFAKRFFYAMSWGKSLRKVIDGVPLDVVLGERVGRKVIPLWRIKKVTSRSHSMWINRKKREVILK